MDNVRSLNPYRLRVVILDSPYDCMSSPEAQSLFGKFIDLKLRGYGGEYPYGVMPVDASDFIGTHLGVFRERGESLTPVLAYKSVNERKCRIHGVPFSATVVAQSSGAERNVRAIQEIIRTADKTGSTVTYDGAWTIDPEARKDRALVAELVKLFACIHVNYHLADRSFDQLCCGVLRFKTERVFQSWGYKPLSLNGESLPAFGQASLKGEMVLMHHTQAFSEEALKVANQYRDYWLNRIEIGKARTDVDQNIIEKKAA